MIELTLSWPPSVNTIWRHVTIGRSARTLLSKDGRQFFEVASLEVLQQRAGRRVTGRAGVEIILHAPNRRAYDIDNRAKAILDALTKGGAWDDDSQLDILIINRGDITPGGQAVVKLWKLEG